jgi:hypothetical protein
VGGANIQIVHYFDHSYLEEEKSVIHSFTVTFGAKYLTGMVTSVPPYENVSLIKNNILHQSKNYKNHFENFIQGCHYFQIRGRSHFSFRELTGRSGRQQREVGRLLGEVNCD